MKSKKVAWYGILIALAFVLSYVESQIPIHFAIPGVKLGLTNLVVLMALYCMDEKSALAINLVRILLVGFTFGNALSLMYSVAGGVLSGLAMILLKRRGSFSMISVSVAGGIFHNVGQVLVAMLLLETTSLLWYLMFLWFSGIGAGIIIGILCGEIVKRIRPGIME